jgi:hypothetical protein
MYIILSLIQKQENLKHDSEVRCNCTLLMLNVSANPDFILGL